MTLNVDELAARTVAALWRDAQPWRRGRRIKRRELEEGIAAALTVAVNDVLDDAGKLLRPERVAAALSIRRHLGVTTMARLEAELRAIAVDDLQQLRPKPCDVTDTGGQERAPSSLPGPSRPQRPAPRWGS